MDFVKNYATRSNARIKPVERVRLSVEMERLRSRLNHDLIKNRLLLALMGLRAIVSGQVAAEDGEAELRQEISDAWSTVKEDAARLIQNCENPGMNLHVLALPFIRQLDEEERKVITEVLTAAEGILERGNKALDDFQQALSNADLLVNVVARDFHASTPAELTSIDRAIDAVGKIAGCLSTLHRQESAESLNSAL